MKVAGSIPAETTWIRPEGKTMRLYHRTTRSAADEILASRSWMSRENTGAVYFSNRLHGQADGYGDAVLLIEVPEHLAQIDDEFPDGEAHFTVHTRDLEGIPVSEVPPGV